MRGDHAGWLVCPRCADELILLADVTSDDGIVEFGRLECRDCGRSYDLVRCIPRFVPEKNYAAGFGVEWNAHARTQYDEHSGRSISEQRFFEETRWPRDLAGERVLEVGSGSGRFTQWAASTGADVVSVDLSSAVEANYRSNGGKPSVLIAQADVYELPVQTGSFDKVVCLGMLQHTPDVKRSFLTLTKYVKPGGSLVVDVYRRTPRRFFTLAYWLRPILRYLPPATLYRWSKGYVKLMWPLARLIGRLPGGTNVNKALMIVDHRDRFPLSDEMLREWAILDTFDWLSAFYNKPQRLETVGRWFEEVGFEDVDVHYGHNGIEGRGRRPKARAAAPAATGVRSDAGR
ncbi:MAG: methyltransferase domain-containing protein [Actinomycetota bacterium]|nr:methyltransferase domain-containing protein [Actinomycetota bacterium]